jgi:nicotinamide mononucleotide transporter
VSLLTLIIEQARSYALPEAIAVLAAIAYLLLAIRQNILCWLFAGISTAIYIGVFVAAKLYMESLLNVFYFVMAIYGWHVWTAGRSDGHERPVVVWPLRTHAIAITGIVIASAISGSLLKTQTDAAFPYIDSLTTWGAIWGTFLVARKVLENWWYWLVIDIASVFIYWSRDLELTSILFVVYVILIPFGLVSWTKSMRAQAA